MIHRSLVRSFLLLAAWAAPLAALAQDAASLARRAATQSGQATQLDEVVVTASRPGDPLPEYAGGQVAEGGRVGLLGDRSVFDTPFSTTAFTATLIQNQQARTVSDLLLNDPSVNTQWPRGTFIERYQIRGFAVSANEGALNGLFGITPTRLSMPEVRARGAV